MKRLLCRTLLLATSLSAIAPASADIIMRVEIKEGANASESFEIQLFEDAAPITVTNFLDFINGTTSDGSDYTDLFVHRSVTDFVVQSGGYSFNSADGLFEYDEVNDLYPGGLQNITREEPIDNEFQRSNLAGTIAMALTSNGFNVNEDSATSQWFINLVDNAFLDDNNFTVFGKVLGDALTTIDAIATSAPPYDKTDVHPAFASLPLSGYTDGDTIDESKLITIPSFTELMNITGDLDFGAVLLGGSSQLTATVTNTGGSAVTLGAVGAVNALTTPFALDAEDCSSATLNPSDSCTLDVSFNPIVESAYLVAETDSIDIDLGTLGISFTMGVSGFGATQVAADMVPRQTSIDYGEVQLPAPGALPPQSIIYFDNLGYQDLQVTSVSVTGPNAAEFEALQNCIDVSPIEPNGFCLTPINLRATSFGNKSANLVIESNDPDSPLIIPITAIVSEDTDGIPVAVEDAIWNGGDGNNDGIKDSLQSNVASFTMEDGTHLTLVSQSYVDLQQVELIPASSLVDIPDGVSFPGGGLRFTADDASSASFIDIGLILPTGFNFEGLYVYGTTVSNSTPHWYLFDFNGNSGVSDLGEVAYTSPSGSIIKRQVQFVRIADGGRGDNVKLVNNIAVFEGAIAFSPTTDSGFLDMTTLAILIILLCSIRIFDSRVNCYETTSQTTDHLRGGTGT